MFDKCMTSTTTDNITITSEQLDRLLSRVKSYDRSIDYYAKCFNVSIVAEYVNKLEELFSVLSMFGIYPDEWDYCKLDGRWHKLEE